MKTPPHLQRWHVCAVESNHDPLWQFGKLWHRGIWESWTGNSTYSSPFYQFTIHIEVMTCTIKINKLAAAPHSSQFANIWKQLALEHSVSYSVGICRRRRSSRQGRRRNHFHHSGTLAVNSHRILAIVPSKTSCNAEPVLAWVSWFHGLIAVGGRQKVAKL